MFWSILIKNHWIKHLNECLYPLHVCSACDDVTGFVLNWSDLIFLNGSPQDYCIGEQDMSPDSAAPVTFIGL